MKAQPSPIAALFAQWRAIKDDCLAFQDLIGAGDPDAEQAESERLTAALVEAEKALEAAPAQSPEDVLLKLTAISAEARELDVTSSLLRLAAEAERVLEAPLRHAQHAMQGAENDARVIALVATWKAAREIGESDAPDEVTVPCHERMIEMVREAISLPVNTLAGLRAKATFLHYEATSRGPEHVSIDEAYRQDEETWDRAIPLSIWADIMRISAVGKGGAA